MTIAPTLNINGTSAADLIDPRRAAFDALTNVIIILKQVTPNGRDYPGNADRCQMVEFVPPAFCVNFAQVADTGTGAPEGQSGTRRIEIMALSAPTPETETSTHYFFGFVRNFGIHDDELHKTQ